MRHRGVRGLVAGEETGKRHENRREEENECRKAEDHCGEDETDRPHHEEVSERSLVGRSIFRLAVSPDELED
jgi:hypothetical protein